MDEALRAAAQRGESTPISFAGWCRFTLRLIALACLLLVFVPLHYAYRIFKYGSPFPMLFLRYSAWICGARIRKIGVPLRRDVFFIANHVSWLDILSLAGTSGTAFVAKSELAEIPFINWLCSLNRTVYVKRESRLDIAEQINALREALEDNWSVTVFPEGTTSDGQSLRPFKTSLLSVLEPPPKNVLVQPVLIDYAADLGEEIGWAGKESGVNNAKRVLARKGSFELRLHFLEPFSPEEFQGRKAIGARARAAIEAALLTALGQPLREFKHDVVPVKYASPEGAPAHARKDAAEDAHEDD